MNTAFLAFVIDAGQDVLMTRLQVRDPHMFAEPEIAAGNRQDGNQFVRGRFAHRTYVGEIQFDGAMRGIDVFANATAQNSGLVTAADVFAKFSENGDVQVVEVVLLVGGGWKRGRAREARTHGCIRRARMTRSGSGANVLVRAAAHSRDLL